MSNITVVHHKKEHHDIYIGRPSKWENPFILGVDGNRPEVIRKYHDWIIHQPQLINDLHELDNKILGCWCKPLKCHGDILILLRENQLLELDDTAL